MAEQPLHLILEPLFSFSGRQVKVREPSQDEAPGDTPAATPAAELATIELDRRIVLNDGSTYTIQRTGASWSSGRTLWRGAGPAPGDEPVATYRRERVGLLGGRRIVQGGTAGAPAYLVRRRSRWGAPSNVDMVLLPAGGLSAEPAGPVVLRVERFGRWKRSLRAVLFDPTAMPLPIALFVLNLLAVQERAAASAASAGA